MSTSTVDYDSDAPRRPLVTELRNVIAFRGLIRLMVMRDLTVRYKRSVLGVWWTILQPLLTSAVMWLVFSQIFGEGVSEVPFAVYLVSGVLFMTAFAQGVQSTGSAIVDSRGVLAKVRVPAEVFSFSAAVAALANFAITLIPLLAIQLIAGVGIPWTIVLVPIPALALLCAMAGIGMLVAAAAVYFYDVLNLTGVITQLIMYLTATFYPLEIVPDRFVIFVELNPMYSYLTTFRAFVYGGTFPELWQFAYMVGSALFILMLGVWAFSRAWRNLVVLL
ncbi:MAG TPA: ABC transporter permease [Nitriliruptorales bacterium]